MATSQGYPANSAILATMQKLGIIPPAGANVLVRPWSIFARLNVPKAGQQNYTFFTETRSSNITNLDNASVLPANYGFKVLGMAFSFLPGFDRTGLRLGIAAPVQAEAEASALFISKYGVTAADPLSLNASWAEKTRELMEQGQVKLTVQDRVMVEEYGLTNFPQGGGIVVDSDTDIAVTNSNTTTVNVANITKQCIWNGPPTPASERLFRTPVPIQPSQSFSVTVDYLRSVDFTTQYTGPLYGITNAVSAGTLGCRLFGLLVSPLS